jgi:hypothetical protein
MQNWSQVFADTLNEFESTIVPADQGDAGKGQVCVRAGYTIHTVWDPNVGYISKSAGQTQFNGVAVDALLDKSDGTGADYLTDVDLGNGTREIRLAYTPYAPPPAGTPLPPTNWVEPTAEYLELPGPLVLKSDPPDPAPEPAPPDNEEVLLRLDVIEQQLVELAAAQSADTAAVLTAIADFRAYVTDMAQDVEDFVNKLGKGILFIRRHRPDDASDEP